MKPKSRAKPKIKKKNVVLGLKFAMVILCTFLLTVSVFASTDQSIIPSTAYDPTDPNNPHYQSNVDPIDLSTITIEITSATGDSITGIIHGEFINADIFAYTDGDVSFNDMSFDVVPGKKWTIKGNFIGHTYIQVVALCEDLEIRVFKSAEFHIKGNEYYIDETSWMPRPEYVAWSSGGVAGKPAPKDGRGTLEIDVEGGGFASGILAPYRIDIKTGWFSDKCFPIQSVTLTSTGSSILTLIKTQRTYFVRKYEDDPNKAYAYYRKYEEKNGECCWSAECKTKTEKFITIDDKRPGETWAEAVERHKPSGCWKSMGYTKCRRTYTDEEGNEYDPRDPGEDERVSTEFKVTGVYPNCVTFTESKIPDVGHIENCYVNVDVKGWTLLATGTAKVGDIWRYYNSTMQQRYGGISIAGTFTYYKSEAGLIKVMSGEGAPCVHSAMPEWLQNALLCEGMPDMRGTSMDVKEPWMSIVGSQENTWMSIADLEERGPVEVYTTGIAPNQMKIFGNSFFGLDITSDSALYNFWDSLAGYSVFLWILTLIMCCGTILMLTKVH